MNQNQNEICAICRATFTPDRRVGERQLACRARRCQQERKQCAKKNWLRQNPDAFQGRYPKLQQWLAQHPGYLRSYRARRHAPVLKPPPGDIQDAIAFFPKNSDLQSNVSEKSHDLKCPD